MYMYMYMYMYIIYISCVSHPLVLLSIHRRRLWALTPAEFSHVPSQSYFLVWMLEASFLNLASLVLVLVHSSQHDTRIRRHLPRFDLIDHIGRVSRLVLSINHNMELMVGTGVEPGESTFRFWNMLDKGHPDSKFMRKLQKRKKRNFVFVNCPFFD